MNPRNGDVGIYVIRNADDGKVYVGSSKEIKRRFWRHKYLLSRGKHHSRHLQSAWNKHGQEKFSFEIVFCCDIESLVFYEQEFLNSLNAADDAYGYNILPSAKSLMGFKHSDETKLKISQIQLGRSLSSECRKKISKTLTGHVGAWRGKRMSDEHKEKISVANKGRKKPPFTEEHRRRIGDAFRGRPSWNLGKKALPEWREKISVAMKGKPWTAARRAAQKKRVSP